MTDSTGTARKRQLLKFGLLGLAAAIALIFIFAILFGAPEPSSTSDISKVKSTNITANAGGEGSDEYNKKLGELDDKKANAALKAGDSFVPTPIGQKKPVLVKKEDAPIPPPPVAPVRTAPVKQAKAADNGMLKRMMEDLKNLDTKLSAFYTGEGKIEYTREFEEKAPEIQKVSSETPQSSDLDIEIKQGDLLYAVIDTGVNSDVPSAVLATVTSGKFKNSRFIGGFQRHEERILLSFTRLVMPSGKSMQVEAYAVDPETSEASVASSVDTHFFSRWGGLIASAFLEGLGSAKRYSGAQSTIYGNMGNTTDQMVWNSYSVEDQAWIAAGKVGEKAGKIFEKNFDRPPTVYLKSGTPVGILILNVKEKK